MIDYDNFTYEIIAVDETPSPLRAIQSISPSITVHYEYEGNVYRVGLIKGKEFFLSGPANPDAKVIGCALAIVTRDGGIIMVNK